ncbi:hypothetical protein LRD18_12550, partial [Halorhodospira halochloris]
MTVGTEGVVCLESRGQRSRGPERWGQAHRLVETRDLDRQAWLAIRRGGIGGSDAAAAVGL